MMDFQRQEHSTHQACQKAGRAPDQANLDAMAGQDRERNNDDDDHSHAVKTEAFHEVPSRREQNPGGSSKDRDGRFQSVTFDPRGGPSMVLSRIASVRDEGFRLAALWVISWRVASGHATALALPSAPFVPTGTWWKRIDESPTVAADVE